jgi:hypothetical protein
MALSRQEREVLEELAWIAANLKPGEKLEDFLPPPQPPPPPLFGTSRVKRWPVWLELAGLAAAVALWPVAAAAGSLAIVAVLVALPVLSIWRGWQRRHEPRPKPWAPPRPIPPFRPRRRSLLWEKADRYGP